MKEKHLQQTPFVHFCFFKYNILVLLFFHLLFVHLSNSFVFFSFEDCFFLNERKKCPTGVRWLRQLVMFADGNLLWQTCSGCFDRRVGIQPQHSAKTWLLGIGLCKGVEKCATWPSSGPIQEYAAQHQWDEGIDEYQHIASSLTPAQTAFNGYIITSIDKGCLFTKGA